MSVNCTENCGRFRKVERTLVSAADIRTIGRCVLRFVAGLASQAAIVIAVLSTSAAAVVRHMIGTDSRHGPHNLQQLFASHFKYNMTTLMPI